MSIKKLNFVFWGTPDVASETLEILKQAGFLPSLIVTSPDARKGRGMHLESSPVAVFADKNNIPYFKPEKIGELGNIFTTSSQADEPRKAIFQQENMRESKKVPQFDLFIVVAYGKIMPENIINIPKLGSVNIHYSLLPKYRGASPVETAILNGNTETGVTIQQMAYRMDSGPIIVQEKVAILPNEKASDLRKRMIKIGAELLIRVLPELTQNRIKTIPQDESSATYCKKIKKEDGLIDLNDNAVVNYNKFRAYAFWPRTFFFRNNKRVIITDAILENNPIDKARGKQFIIKKIIQEGGKEIEYKE